MAQPQGALGGAQADGAVPGDAPGQGERCGAGALALRGELIDQAERGRLVGGDPARGVDQLGRAGGADPAGQQLGAAAAGDDADGHLGQADHGRTVGDDQVAGERQLEAAAEGVTVHRGDGRHRQVEHTGVRGAGVRPLPAEFGVRQGVALLEVGADAEGLLAG